MFENIMTVAGFILAIASAIYAVWVYRKSKRNTALLFKRLECYTLFEPDVKRLNIELSYNNQPIRNNLILLKACLRNTGQVDIDKNRIFRPLKIIAQKNYKWLEVRQILVPDGAATSIKVTSNDEIVIEWDLLKSNEIIEFECLVEIEDAKAADFNTTDEFLKSLKFDYRITDLRSISREKEDTYEESKFSKMVRIASPWAMILVPAIFIFTMLLPANNESLVNYDIGFTITDSNQTKMVSLKSEGKNQIGVVYENGSCDNLTVKEFNSKYKISSVHNDKGDKVMKYVILAIVTFFLILGITLLLADKKT